MILGKKYVKVGVDLNEGDLLKILDEGQWVEKTQYKNQDGTAKKACEFEVELSSGVTKTISMNGVSRTNLMEAWGNDTSKWIGKLAVAHIKDTFVGGKDVKMIILAPEESQE